jgi:predicted AlkP superfamily phosphohydrolase/phosphomutase
MPRIATDISLVPKQIKEPDGKNIINEMDKKIEFSPSARSSAKTIIDIMAKKFRFGKDLLLNKTNKQISVAGTHFGTHSYPINLFEMLIGKIQNDV